MPFFLFRSNVIFILGYHLYNEISEYKYQIFGCNKLVIFQFIFSYIFLLNIQFTDSFHIIFLKLLV